MDGSRVQVAAISGMVACGLLVGGAGGFGVAVATATPGDTRGADSTPRDRGDRAPRAEKREQTRDRSERGPRRSTGADRSTKRTTGSARSDSDAESRQDARAGKLAAAARREERKIDRRAALRERSDAEADAAGTDKADRLRRLSRRAVRAAGSEDSEGWSVERKGPRRSPPWHGRHKDRHEAPDGPWRPPWDCDDPDPQEPTEPEVPDVVESGGGSDGPRVQWGVQRDVSGAAAEAEPSTRTLDVEKVLRAALAAPPPPPPTAAVPVIAPVPVVVVPAPAAALQPAVPPPPPPPSADRPVHEPAEATGSDDLRAAPAVPAAFRAGYPDYLRTAPMTEIAGLALAGTAGLLGLTAVGGLVGYRQARAGHAVRAAGTARFLQ